MSKLCLLPAGPFPWLTSRPLGISWMTGQGSVTLTLWPGWRWLPDPHPLLVSTRFPLYQQEPAVLPVSGKGSTQRQLQKCLTSPLPALLPTPLPERMVSDHIRGVTRVSALPQSTDTLVQGKLAVQGGQNSTAQGQASWEGAVMAGATFID